MNRGFIVPDEMTMQRMPAHAKAQLRERLIGSLRALHVPSPVIHAADRVHYVRALDPAQIVADARTLYAIVERDEPDVIAERQRVLLDATKPRRVA